MFCVEGLASSYGPPVHRTLQYTIQCVLYSVYYTLCTIQYTVCTIMCVLYSVFYSVCTIQFVPYSAMCSTPCSARMWAEMRPRMWGILLCCVVRNIPTCSPELVKGIGVPATLMWLTILARFTEWLFPAGEKPRSFVFSGTRVT